MGFTSVDLLCFLGIEDWKGAAGWEVGLRDGGGGRCEGLLVLACGAEVSSGCGDAAYRDTITPCHPGGVFAPHVL